MWICSNDSEIIAVRGSTRIAVAKIRRWSPIAHHGGLREMLQDKRLVELLHEPHGPAPSHGQAADHRVYEFVGVNRLPVHMGHAEGDQQAPRYGVEAKPACQLHRNGALPKTVLHISLTDPQLLLRAHIHLQLSHGGQRSHFAAWRDSEEGVHLTAIQHQAK